MLPAAQLVRKDRRVLRLSRSYLSVVLGDNIHSDDESVPSIFAYFLGNEKSRLSRQ